MLIVYKEAHKKEPDWCCSTQTKKNDRKQWGVKIHETLENTYYSKPLSRSTSAGTTAGDELAWYISKALLTCIKQYCHVHDMKWVCSLRSSGSIQSTRAQPGLPSRGQRMSAPNGSADSQKTVFISMKVGSPEHHRPFLFTGTRDKMPKESRNPKHFLLNIVHSPISKLPHDCLVYSPNMKSLHGQIKTSCWIHTKRAPCILKANKKQWIYVSHPSRYVALPAVKIHQRGGIAYLGFMKWLAIGTRNVLDCQICLEKTMNKIE